ncbi:MAG: quinolinate synthase NadA [Deltaproteobacteria bacterium]|jgi:quinolinate synthase|nr:quinolinate synthase NadA [Deltaproteobacteria bacterium]
MGAISERKLAQARRVSMLAEAGDVEIIAHFYQRAEVKALAHYVGGSRGLYDWVLKTRARAIMVCGVEFMLGAMERLRPDLEFLVPRKDAGCPFSDSVGAQEVEMVRRSCSGPVRPLIVADIKASAAVRDLADLVLTGEPLWPPDFDRRSVHVLPALSGGNPDRVPHFDWPGAVCQVHQQVGPQDIRLALSQAAGAKIAANSLCRPEVRALADFVGDSQAIFDWCAAAPGGSYLIVSETGLAESLREAFPGSRFYETEVEVFCPNMKLVNIKDLLACLEAFLPQEVRNQAQSLSAEAGT